MTCAEFQALAHAYALAALEADEDKACAEHLAEPKHQGCVELLSEAQKTLAALSSAVTPMPVDVWDRIEAALPVKSKVRALPWLVAVAASIGWLATYTAMRPPPPLPDRELAALLAQPGTEVVAMKPQPGVQGNAVVVINRQQRRAIFWSASLAPVPGKDFELWTIHGKSAPEPVGLATVQVGGLSIVDLELPPGAFPDALAISREPAGGSKTPTEVLMIAAL